MQPPNPERWDFEQISFWLFALYGFLTFLLQIGFGLAKAALREWYEFRDWWRNASKK